MRDGFVQAHPAGHMLNTLVLVGQELIEVTPTSPELIQSSYDLAVGMNARFFFRRVRNEHEHRWDLDGYDVRVCRQIVPPPRTNRLTIIEPQRRFPSKDAAAMWALHRSAR